MCVCRVNKDKQSAEEYERQKANTEKAMQQLMSINARNGK